MENFFTVLGLVSIVMYVVCSVVLGVYGILGLTGGL
jgi:hypothetical protein